LDEYEKRAVELATKPEICAAYREHLLRIHDTGAVFDTALFVRNLEQQLKSIAIGVV
jgi:hypothetical protein